MALHQSFIDHINIFVKAGDGGNGACSFRREKYIPNGGPDGGDGGRGGSVFIVASKHKSTLLDFRRKKHFKAQSGKQGSGQQKTGPSGEDLIIEVPPGTVISHKESGEILGEVLSHGEQILIQDGGKGGLGNIHFVSSTNRAPRQFTEGGIREGFWIHLELKILADIGIIGQPNAGKSTLLSAITKAKSKTGDYPFTTLHPHIGVLQTQSSQIVLADMPGLIEGAHEGTGLGTEFLRHIERNKALLYVVAAKPGKLEEIERDLQTVRNEITHYDASLADRPSMIAINKIDLLSESEKTELYSMIKKWTPAPILISAKSLEGIHALLDEFHRVMGISS